MTTCLLHTRAATILGAGILLLTMAPSALARDASLPYRSYPGFQCHQWNALGECNDWSYLDNRTSPPPVYGGTPVARPTYPVSRCQNPMADCTGSVSVRVTATPNTVSPGEELTYSIYIRNDDSQERTVNVRAFPDQNAVGFVSATFGGYSDGNTVRWDALGISPARSRTLQLRVRTRSNAVANASVSLRVQAANSSDSATAKVIGSGMYYGNAVRDPYMAAPVYPPSYQSAPVYPPYNQNVRPTRYRRNDIFLSDYYYGNNANNLRYPTVDESSGFYCDSTKFVCQW